MTGYSPYEHVRIRDLRVRGRREEPFSLPPPTFPSSTSMAEPGEYLLLPSRVPADSECIQTLARFKISDLVLLGQFRPLNRVMELSTSETTT